MKGKIRLGKTATSRSRKKAVSEVSKLTNLPQDDFIQWLLSKGYSDSSVERFCGDLQKFRSWLETENLEIEEVQYNDITAYLQGMGGVAQHTKACYLRGIKHYFDFLIWENERTDNPVAYIQIKGQKRRALYDILDRQELDKLYNAYTLPDENSKNKNQNWFRSQVLSQQRNKVILGLLLYQGLDTIDLKLLSVSNIKLREGTIFIPGTRRSNERELKLEAMQIMDMMEYMLKTRKEIQGLTGKQSDQFIVSVGSSDRIHNIMIRLMKRLCVLNGKVSSSKQLRASVIVHWLKLYNLRQVQYMAGHRYVSSTESYLVNEMEEMIEDIEKYHPIT